MLLNLLGRILVEENDLMKVVHTGQVRNRLHADNLVLTRELDASYITKVMRAVVDTNPARVFLVKLRKISCRILGSSCAELGSQKK